MKLITTWSQLKNLSQSYQVQEMLPRISRQKLFNLRWVQFAYDGLNTEWLELEKYALQDMTNMLSFLPILVIAYFPTIKFLEEGIKNS